MDLKGLYKSNRRRYSLIILLLFLTAFANTMSSYLYKPAVDYLAKDNLKNTLYYFFIMILIGLLSIVIEAFAQTVYSKQVQEYLGLLRQKIVAHFYAKNNTSVSEMQNDLSSNLDMLADNYAMPLQTIIGNSFTLIMIIGVLIQLNWSLLVLTAVLAVISLLTLKIIEKATDKANKQVSIENSRLLKIGWVE
ncbi:ABC transporter transmembrane domain-containing protein [Lactobacillus acidophilus]